MAAHRFADTPEEVRAAVDSWTSRMRSLVDEVTRIKREVPDAWEGRELIHQVLDEVQPDINELRVRARRRWTIFVSTQDEGQQSREALAQSFTEVTAEEAALQVVDRARATCFRILGEAVIELGEQPENFELVAQTIPLDFSNEIDVTGRWLSFDRVSTFLGVLDHSLHRLEITGRLEYDTAVLGSQASDELAAIASAYRDARERIIGLLGGDSVRFDRSKDELVWTPTEHPAHPPYVPPQEMRGHGLLN